MSKFASLGNKLLPRVQHGTLLYIENLSVSFDGFKAIDDLSLYLADGELRCVIGPNGAGKTTMMDIITGRTKPDSGTVWLGQNLDLLTMDESQIALAGIGRKFQRPTIFENLTVRENLELSIAGPKGVLQTYRARLSAPEEDKINEILGIVGLKKERDDFAGILSHGQKQWLEIGMLLIQDPRLLLIDEPVAGMTQEEMERTAELLQRLAGNHTIVVVEHDMEFIRAIARKVTVLHQGSVLAEGTMDDMQNNQKVIEVYLGH